MAATTIPAVPAPTATSPTIPLPLDDYLTKARELNPEYSDTEIAAQYHTEFPTAAASQSAPPKDSWLAEAAKLNPDYSPQEHLEAYNTLYPKQEVGMGENVLNTLKDIGIKTAQGVVGLGQSVVGIGDLASGGKIGSALHDIGYDPKATNAYLGEYLSEAQKASEQAVNEATGFVDTLVAAATHPRAVGGYIAEAAPSMIGMTAPARLLATHLATKAAAPLGGLATPAGQAAAKAAVAAAAGKLMWVSSAGEGVEQAGSLAEEARAEGKAYSDYAIPAIISGVTDALIAKGAGKLIGDPLTALMTGAKTAGVSGSLAPRVLKSIFSEGVLEELPQSYQEQVFQNIAMGKPWDEGAAHQAAIGAVTGGVMGGGLSAVAGRADVPTPVPTPPGTPPPPPKEDPIAQVAPIGDATSVDEAISTAQTLISQPASEVVAKAFATTEPVGGPLETAAAPLPGEAPPGVPTVEATISQQLAQRAAGIPETVTAAQEEIERVRHQASLEKIYSSLRQESGEPVAVWKNGVLTYGGTEIKVIAPSALPVSTPPDGPLSQSKVAVVKGFLSLFGKELSIYDAPEGSRMHEGVAWQSVFPDLVFVSNQTKSTDLMSVAVHELFHTLEGTNLYQTMLDTVWDNRTALGVEIGRARHGDLDESAMKRELLSDIAGTELPKEHVWNKVITNLTARIGVEEAKGEVVTLLDQIKGYVEKVKNLITLKPWSVDQKELAGRYVSKMEAIHDAIAAAASDVIYKQHFAGTAKEKAEKSKLSLRMSPGRTVVHPVAAAAFEKAGAQQRATGATHWVHQATAGGVLNPVVEHAGELLRRMTEGAKRGEPNLEIVRTKIDKLLAALEHPYGFEKQLSENLQRTADRYGKPVAHVQQLVDATLEQYTKAHQQLPVYNRAQWLAREIPVTIGQQRFKDAVSHLRELKRITESPAYAEQAFAHTLTLGETRRYTHPVRVSTEGLPPSVKREERYTLLEPIPGHAAGDVVSRDTLSRARRAPHLVDVGPRASSAKPREVDAEARTTLSTTVPTAVSGFANALTQVWHISGAHIRESADHVKSISAALRAYPGMSGKGTQLQVLSEFHKVVTSNILWLYDLVPDPIRKRATMWYTGAHRIASEWAEEDGYTLKQHAAVIAVNSPQSDWYMNMSRADRIRKIVKNYGQFAFSQEMLGWVEAYAADARSDENIEARARFLDLAKSLLGKKLDDLEGTNAGAFVRFFDETYHSKHYRVVTPEGGFKDYVRKLPRRGKSGLYGEMLGEPANMAWKSFAPIAKSVSILRDGSNANIHTQLGMEHKVRSFYNNILDPKSTEGHVTIDTHATGAGIVSVVASDDIEPSHTFGKGGSNVATGASGSYGLLADAYRDAAKQRNILPSSMQSVTWEAIRSIFPDTMKKTLRPQVEKIWKDVRKGRLTIEKARTQIYALAGGIKEFDWEHGGLGLSPAQGGKSFDEGMKTHVATAATGTRQLRGGGGVPGGQRILFSPSGPYQDAGQVGETLVGLPSPVAVDGEDVEFFGFKRAQDAAKDYMKSAGLVYVPETVYHKLDKEQSTRIANVYEAMAHEPNDPDVKAAYAAMIKETAAQYKAILKTGLVVEFFPNNEDTYGNPRNAILDVVMNNHFYVFSTRAGFGSNAQFDASKNPLLAETEFKVGTETMLVNDLFRVVHDYFGHIKDGVGFRAEGEDNAWYSHVAMYSPLAARAMTTETRGQNSWVNYGPHGEHNRKASPKDTIYADQKTGLLPEFASRRVPKEGTVGPAFSAAQVLDTLKNAVPHTTLPGNTYFLLPDGTRLTAPKELGRDLSHFHIAKQAGFELRDVVAAGAIRYLPSYGVEVASPLTTTQAEMLIDDWFGYNTTLEVDVMTPEGVTIAATEFDVPNEAIDPSGLQAWVAARLERGLPSFSAAGTVTLEHFSKQKGLTTISPKFHGTGQIGAERLRMLNEGKSYLPRSYFYRAGTKAEPRFKGLTKYTVGVQESDLVDLATYTGTPSQREIQAKKDGYKGFYNSQSSMPNVVAMFTPVPVGVPTLSSRTPVETFPITPPGKLDKIIRVLQDKNVDIRQIVKDVRAAGRAVSHEVNPVLAEEMYQKREQQQSDDFTNDELKPLVNKMADAGVTLDQLDAYLHARHVVTDKVNAKLEAMNPTLPNNTALSGITDAEAQKILASAPPIMATLAKDVDAMIATTRDLMVQYGLEKQETIADWKKTYQAYVPLRREGFDQQAYFTGAGRSVRGSTVKTRGGSTLEVESILANVAQARDQIISRGEKQRPVIAFAAMLIQNPNPTIGKIDKAVQIEMEDPNTGLTRVVASGLTGYSYPTMRVFDAKTGLMKDVPDPGRYKDQPNVVNFRVKGEDYAIVFNEHIERSMEAAKAFKNLGTDPLSGLFAIVAPYTRYLASINTQYNPIFGIVNFVRDAQYAMLTLASTPLAGKQLEVLKNATLALRGIYEEARAVRTGNHVSTPLGRMWQRFEHVGGPTGYRDMFTSTESRVEEIERLMNPSAWGGIRNPRQLGKRIEETHLFKLLSDYNTTMENSIRLGVFKTAVEGGMSDIEAASLAKNITVNFNAKGQIGSQMGSLYAFFNANVQGSARIAETLFERTPGGFKLSALGKKIITGGLLVGVLQTFLLAMAGFDEDEPPEFVKQKNLILPAPWTDKGYVMVPMPLGFNLLPTVGRLAAETVYNGMRGKPLRAIEKGTALIGAMFDTLSPIGGGTSPTQFILPTVADPLGALNENKDWSGRAIFREDINTLKPTPGLSRTRDTATAWAKGLSYAINWATGGTDFTPGTFSPTPDAIDYLIGQVTGGIGRETAKTAQAIQAAVSGETLPVYKYPLVGRFVGTGTGEAAEKNRFYENLKKANLALQEVEGRAKTGQAFSEFLAKNPAAMMAKAGVKIQSALGELRKQREQMKERGASRDDLKLIDLRSAALIKQFNERMEEVTQ